MTVEEIFNKIGSHMKEGLMYHDEMARAYDFLGLYGYSQCQNYHFIEEAEGYRCLSHYYTSHYYKLLQLENIEYPKLFPESWYKYTTMAVDAGTKRNSIKDLLTKWIDWEKSTKKLYQEMWKELHSINEVAAAKFLEQYIEDVTEELHFAEKTLFLLETISYDMVTIITHQEDLYKKYKKKLGW